MSARPSVYLRKGVRVRFKYSHQIFVVMGRRKNRVRVRPLFDQMNPLAEKPLIPAKALIALQEHPAR